MFRGIIMEKEFFDKYNLDKKDFKEDNDKCKKLSVELQIEKFDLERYMNKKLEYSPELSEAQNILNKFALKEMGKELVKAKEYDKAILHFESLLDNTYFENDYYVYRQLAIYYLRTKPKRYDDQLEIIKRFFKSGIYGSHNQYLWFSNKLFELRDKGYTTDEEIYEFSQYFLENGNHKKGKENSPVILADRIFKKHNGYVDVDTQYFYERAQRRQELEFIGQQFKNDGDYDKVIEFFEGVFEYTDFDSIRMYEILLSAYEQLGDYESMLIPLSTLFRRNYIRGETNKIKFNKKLNFVNKKLGTSYTIEDLKEFNFKDVKAENTIIPNNNQPIQIKKEVISNNDLLLQEMIDKLNENGSLTIDEFALMKKELDSKENNDSLHILEHSGDNNSNNEKVTKNSPTPVITVARNNFNKLKKSNVGDEIIVKRLGGDKCIILQITDIKKRKLNGSPEDNIINVDKSNFKIIKNLKQGDLIVIKTKRRPGSVTLRILSGVKDYYKYIYNNETDSQEPLNNISEPIDKYIHSFSLPEYYDFDLENPFEFDDDLTDEENIKRKFILKQTGSRLERPDEAISFFENLKNNSYFKNDWYPYRQLAMIYNDFNKYEENIKNIKQLFYSGIYLNGYQYVWFINKLNSALNSVSVDQNEIELWVDHYWENGAKNKDKLDNPIFIADRIVKREDRIKVYSKEQFYDDYQLLSELEEKLRFAEKVGDYENMLNTIILYYTDYYQNISHKKTMRFRRKLKLVNELLGTDYKYTDFI